MIDFVYVFVSYWMPYFVNQLVQFSSASDLVVYLLLQLVVVPCESGVSQVSVVLVGWKSIKMRMAYLLTGSKLYSTHNQ